MDKALKQRTRLNGICPYFTMFPLDFPYTILREHAAPGDWVADPFCGRGTTNYAGRVLGLPSIGIDSSPVAVAISQAKLANSSPQAIVRAAERILARVPHPQHVPAGEFWQWAFHPQVLHLLCRLREGLLQDCRSEARRALRAIILGALHGPRPKSHPAYFSNQAQRTYAPKPAYAVRFWQKHNLKPEAVEVLDIIKTRAERYYAAEDSRATGRIVQGDSRSHTAYRTIDHPLKWVITSPPYYGMSTYLPDQWLRLWFLGGPPTVTYTTDQQVEHRSPEIFAAELNTVWRNMGAVCAPGARLVVRFGGINDRKADPMTILNQSLAGSGWVIDQTRSAGFASAGRRQALHIKPTLKQAREEYDVWATWSGG